MLQPAHLSFLTTFRFHTEAESVGMSAVSLRRLLCSSAMFVKELEQKFEL